MPSVPAADLVAALGGLVPDAGVHVGVLLGQPPGQRDDLGERQLDDAAGVGERRVEHRDAAGRGGGQVDLVGADAERADRHAAAARRPATAAVTWVLDRMPSRCTPPMRVDQLVLVERAPERTRPGSPRPPAGRPRRGGCPPAEGTRTLAWSIMISVPLGLARAPSTARARPPHEPSRSTSVHRAATWRSCPAAGASGAAAGLSAPVERRPRRLSRSRCRPARRSAS